MTTIEEKTSEELKKAREEMIKSAQWDLNYHTLKVKEAEIRLKVLNETN